MIIPVIDIFAGPGGLGEGFAAFRCKNGDSVFKIVLSVEKESWAYQTLLLRSFFRQFQSDDVPFEYFNFLKNPDKSDAVRMRLFNSYPIETQRATNETVQMESGRHNADIFNYISKSLGNNDNWVLIGGPPCQAYSLAGRSRNKGNPRYKADSDERQYLYVEYLQVIAEYRPAVFIMENVKGLLSATVNNQMIFKKIIEDLQEPYRAIRRKGRSCFNRNCAGENTGYRIFSLVKGMNLSNSDLDNFIVKMEKYGIPQSRHRVFLLGIREDVCDVYPNVLQSKDKIPMSSVITGLPAIRSGLSREEDNQNAWRKAISRINNFQWYLSLKDNGKSDVFQLLGNTLKKDNGDIDGRGSEFIECEPNVYYEQKWFLDSRLGGICNHSSRSHIREDLYRYLYASCYAMARRRSPCLKDFPAELLPLHNNVGHALKGGMFADRFRVQLADQPATTITSHIAKDGHYYIHPDPSQCRSLTVREAARIQTFPDNYFFCGHRTAQYHQVGNAVPPLLAKQIAEIIYNIFHQKGLIS